jgi:predicted DNA-binding ribbon-helix-helix protein
MCRIFATQDPASYALIARALRLNGHTTSIRLEAAYWTILDEIAANEGLTTPRFIGKLYDEVLGWHGEVANFTSMLRVTCTLYLRMAGPGAGRGEPDGVAEPAAAGQNHAVVT